MAELNHPDAPAELAHLKQTLDLIAREQVVAHEELSRATEELNVARKYDPDALPLREMLYARANQSVRNLEKAYLRPYFTRVDFIEAQDQVKREYYIGRYGVMHSDTLEPEVIDWRSPVANLYYSGQVGPMHYVTPDGDMQGELTLKRQFGIEDSKLLTIFDTGVVSQDAYLQSVLGAVSGDRLREIVTTIQAEQNYVIRHPLNVPLVVQGVAGSGKTTIALHRIAYLLYTFQDKLQPEHMMILAPNPLFLNYISGVLPDLGVERVKQTTFPLLMAEWLGKALPKAEKADTLEHQLAMAPEERERAAQIAHVKGSLEMEARLNAWLDQFEERLVPEGDLLFGPVRLYSRDQLRDCLLKDLKPFPLERRVKEFKKILTRKVKEAANKVIEWLMEECERRVERLMATLPNDEARRGRIRALYDSRDQRIQQSKDQIKPYIKQVLDGFPSLQPLDCYRAFWQDQLDSTDEDLRAAAQYTVQRLKAKRPSVDAEDAAPLAMMAMRLIELSRMDVRHIVIDEAQDFSPLEFMLLRRMSRDASMTVVGDLMQGVHAWRGLTDWKQLTGGVFEGKAVQHYLVTSYRNTVEIMNCALRVARNRPTPGQREAKPVLRHGPEPGFTPFETAEQQAALVAEIIRKWREEGMSTIAVVDRTEKQLSALMKRLPKDLNIRLLDVNDESYSGGILAAPASSVKGLEFDGVIMADLSEDHFQDQELDARLLYVCLTRPLHRLAGLYRGELTPLLK